MCLNFYSGDVPVSSDLMLKCASLLNIQPSFIEKCINDSDTAKQALQKDLATLKRLENKNQSRFQDRDVLIQINQKVLGPRKSRTFQKSPRNVICRMVELGACESGKSSPQEFFTKNDLQTNSSSEIDVPETDPENREKPAKVDETGEVRIHEKDLDLIYNSDGLIDEVRQTDPGKNHPEKRPSNEREQKLFENELFEIDQNLSEHNLSYLVQDVSTEKAYLSKTSETDEQVPAKEGSSQLIICRLGFIV